MAASEITEFIINVLVDKYGYAQEDLAVEDPFEELDFDSLVFTELAGMLNRAYGVDLVDDDLAEAGSIDAVGRLVEQRMPVTAGLTV